MTFSQRWSLRALLLVGIATCVGCNPIQLFSLFKGESRQPASLKNLTDAEKKKEVKVAIVASGRLDARQELLNAHRELTQKIAEQLRTQSAANGDKLTVVEP